MRRSHLAETDNIWLFLDFIHLSITPMRTHTVAGLWLLIILFAGILPKSQAQIGRRFPSEKRVVTDPVTGTKLTFLTSTPAGDSKIYQTHNQWTADGEWVIFRSDRVKGEAFAVHEKTGAIVQVTEGGYTGMLNVARKSMKLYFMRKSSNESAINSLQIVEVDLAKLFADSQAGALKEHSAYQRICGTTPPALEAGGDMALDGGEEWAWFRVGKGEAMKHLPEGTKIEEAFGPRKMGAGPAGIAGMNVHTGEIKYVVSVPFQIGHIQSNPWVPGQVVFCWETGGKAPQRTWIVNADGSGLRPLYPEASYEWITHEAVISPNEVAFAIMGHRKIPNASGEAKPGTVVGGANPGQEAAWGPSGTREKPTGLGIVNIDTREMTIAGQIPFGSGFWHVNGSSDGRFVAGDDFERNIYLIDRKSHEMILLSAGHKTTAADHPHPTFSPDGTRIEIQSAMLSVDNKSMNICIIPVPKKWLAKR
jgi:oligogalacturonide lyase